MEFPNKHLLSWYEEVKRPLPWRDTRDPYRIWVSEIILQQTRVDQGWPYYDRFISQFPTVHDLANATQDEVLKTWEGLGYYSRARNMHATAKHISNNFNGTFPNTIDGLLKLKGIGSYTAAAIGSIAFGLRSACIDGNVIRVISRLFGIEEPVDKLSTKKQIELLARQILDRDDPAGHNQAMMELGATCCLPKQPTCTICPLAGMCVANANGIQQKLPVKSKKTKVSDRYFYYLIYLNNGRTRIEKRPSGDLWEGLYQFPLVETASELTEDELFAHLNILPGDNVVSVSKQFKHVLSHQRIFAKFIVVKKKDMNFRTGLMIGVDAWSEFPMPRLIVRYLEDHPLVINAEV